MNLQTRSTRDVVDITVRHTYGTWRVQKGWLPLHIIDADGCYFTDASGKNYLDFSSQLMCVSLGHKNQAVIKAIEDQARSLPYVAPGFTTTVRSELSELLLEVLPGGLKKFFFTTSGTEANEAAMKIARMVTGRSKIIARYRSYHGSTLGSMAITGDPRRWAVEPAGKAPNVVFAPEADCYRCPLGHHYPECNIACAEYLLHMIDNEGDVAAVIVEPIVGTNGVLVPPKEYLPRLREICDARDVLLIVDEVMTGWCRTGQWFAVDHWGVKPDILVTAKGITSAYAPLGLCATTDKLAAHFDDHFFSHGHTYEAHPLTLAPAVAAIREMQRLKLSERSQEMGEYLGKRLRTLKENHPSIGDVRGLGLFWAVELVRNRSSKEAFNTKFDKVSGRKVFVDQLAAEMLKEGLYVQSWLSHFILAPPLIVSRDQIDDAVRILDSVLRIADGEVET